MFDFAYILGQNLISCVVALGCWPNKSEVEANEHRRMLLSDASSYDR